MLFWLTACGSTPSNAALVKTTFLQIAPSEFPSPPVCVASYTGSGNAEPSDAATSDAAARDAEASDAAASDAPSTDAGAGNSDGTYLSYVATLVDVTTAAPEPGSPVKRQLSSPPAPCRSGLRFDDTFTATDREYMAWVDAYPYPAEALTPVKRDSRSVKLDGIEAAPSYRFLCAGKGVEAVNAALAQLAADPPDPALTVDPGRLGLPVKLVAGRTVLLRGCVQVPASFSIATK
jgi:hypothetical protein